MASQDARLSKFKADFKQQQGEMTNKFNTVLKAITNRITGALPNDMVKNSELNVNSTSLVLPARFTQRWTPMLYHENKFGSTLSQYVLSNQTNPVMTSQKKKGEKKRAQPKTSTPPPPSPPNLSISFITEKVHKLNSFIEKYDDCHKEGPEDEENATTEGLEVEYFDTFPTRSELAYHKYLMSGLIPSLFLRNPIIKKPVYLRNEEDNRRGVEYVISKILGFYKECLELRPEYSTGVAEEGEVTLYLMTRNSKVLRSFKRMILGGRFNQLSYVSSPLLSKPGEY
ncbi:hypothetical protein Tco_0276815 [Tanacetum coccineum]